jgi:hypothetical protein
VRGQGLTADAAAEPAPDLGAIASFTGTFKGSGFNTIFRPQDFAVTPTPLPNPTHGPDDNILELNPTEETLSFSPALGSIPNRGMVQGDVFLNGIPYLQTINDVSDPAQPVGIHFEPGVWLSVPPTTAPAEGATLVRMASIPHGTTIEAQGTSFTVAGGPVIKPVDITPFPIGKPGSRIRFPSQNVNDTAPNANAIQMTAIFWIETVLEQITVPACSPGQSVIVQGNASAGNPVASFAVSPATEITADTQIDVTYTQIQYTQTVFLNFNDLTWPHVSVATLVPNDPIPITL